MSVSMYIIMAFKVLMAAKLNKMDTKLVLTGVEYNKGKKKVVLLLQMKESFKIFKGREVLEHKEGVIAMSSTYNEMEQVLIAKG